MAILNQIMRPMHFQAPPAVRPPIPAVDPGMMMRQSELATRHEAQRGNGMDMTDKLLRQFTRHEQPAGGVPGAGGGAPSPNPYGSGIMGSIMQAFNSGGANTLDPSKLMALLGLGM